MKKLSLHEIRSLELEVLDDVVAFCEDKRIDYFLTAGTLLGAVRHQGFIPWDDDIDITMPRESYERFIATYRSKRGFELLSCHADRRYWYPFVRVHNPETYLPYRRRTTLNMGVCIDIFPLDAFMSSSQIRMRRRLIVFLMRLGAKGWESSFQKMFRSSGLKALVLWPLANQYLVNFYMRAIDWLAKVKPGREKSFCAVPVAPCYKAIDIFRKEDIFPMRKTGIFEGRVYNIPNNPDAILKGIYGDYMKLPPAENQRPAHFTVAYAREGVNGFIREEEIPLPPLTLRETGILIGRSLLPESICVWLLIQACRIYHYRSQKRIREKWRHGERLRVFFLDAEIAKWKCQSLYDAMCADPRFEPLVGLMRRDNSMNWTVERHQAKMLEARCFYESRGCKCVDLYDATVDCTLDLSSLQPDIVFYQQPWGMYGNFGSQWVSRYALTCYVPYFTPIYGFPGIDAHQLFHRCLAYYFMLNQSWVDFYRQGVRTCFFSGKLIPVGQPMLDVFLAEEDMAAPPEYVIYAPHFSFGEKCILKTSTFAQNGQEILRYAKSHPEIKWIFKPHPALRVSLQKDLGYTEEQVQDYYDAWSRIGKVCEEGNYIGLFKQARALITDCLSFLAEFGGTGRPVIHLISSRNNYVSRGASRRLLESYYNVHNLDEMYKVFNEVLVAGQDPKRDERMKAAREAGLVGVNAAQNILDCLFPQNF